jgi:bacillithiol system protein YtxJ
LAELLVELQNIHELNEALQESFERPILLFKHSLICPVSTRAFDELRSFLAKADSSARYRLIRIQKARDVSNEVTSRLHVRHESPQAILVRDGREVWNASHSNITASTLAKAIGTNR